MNIKCSGLEIDINYTDSTIETVYVPEFELKKGSVLCLHLPKINKAQKKVKKYEFFNYLTGKIKKPQISIFGSVIKVEPVSVPNNIWSNLFPKKVKNILKDLSGNEFSETFVPICEKIGISLDDNIRELSYSQRNLFPYIRLKPPAFSRLDSIYYFIIKVEL